MKRVVITGIGALTPLGNTSEDYKIGLYEGVSGAAPITLFDASLFKTQFACEVKGFDPFEMIDRREARRMDRFTQFAMVVADQAIKDSGLDLEHCNPDEIGVIWGSGIGGLSTLEADVSTYATGDGTPRFSPFLIPKMIPDIAPGLISMKYNFRGPNYATVSACASSTHAIMTAFDYIRLGRTTMMLTGGSEATVTYTGIGGFNAMKALSTRNDSYTTASRPFDATRDGFVLGEGGAALFLEEYEHAKARGATIYAEVIGGAATADAYHMTAPHPEGLGAAKVMQNTLKDAQITSDKVDYINVHGTSTPLGDIAELNAIKKVFRDDIYNLNISSTKSMTGHLLGAAGAIEALACIFALNDGVIPPTINHEHKDPNIDPKLNLTPNEAQEKAVTYALSNTFGFGGHNASILMKKI